MKETDPRSSFCRKVCTMVRSIPHGRVATYGMIAAYAGSPRGARTVAWVLHSCSEKEQLPWHRVVNRMGAVSLRHGRGHEVQRHLLEEEAVSFDEKGRIDLERYLWRPGSE